MVIHFSYSFLLLCITAPFIVFGMQIADEEVEVSNVTLSDEPDPSEMQDDDVEDRKNEKNVIRCKQHNDLDLLDNIVGIGWDNLRNLPMGEVFATSVILCRTTPDGQWLVPDNVIALEEKKSKLDNMASFSATAKEHLHATANGISVEGTVPIPKTPLTVGASFGKENQESKQLSMSTESSILRTGLTYHAYSFVVDAPNAAFTPDLEERLVEIGWYIERKEFTIARYLSELIIRDYGTHVITRAKVGAEIVKEDYVDMNSMRKGENSMNAIRGGASLGFKDIVKVEVKKEKKTEKGSVNEFDKSLRESRIKCRGAFSAVRIREKVLEAVRMSEEGAQGLPPPQTDQQDSNYQYPDDTNRMVIDPNTGLKLRIPRPRHLDGSKSEVEDVVSLDHSGEPLYHMINKYTVPSLDSKQADKVAFFVRKAYMTYAMRNTVKGCMDPSLKGYDPNANSADSSTCNQETISHQYELGGIFQVSHDATRGTVTEDIRVNGITGNYSCPWGYKHKLIGRVGPVTSAGSIATVLLVCEAINVTLLPNRSGYLFGGAFSDTSINPFLGTKSCPAGFQAIHVFQNLTLCVSRNYEKDYKHAVDYGGLLSCQMKEKNCKQGFSNYLIGNYTSMGKSADNYEEIGPGCEIYVCIRPSQIKEITMANIKLPPFTRIFNDTDNSNNTTNTTDTTPATPTPTPKPAAKFLQVWENVSPRTKKRPKSTTTLGQKL